MTLKTVRRSRPAAPFTVVIHAVGHVFSFETTFILFLFAGIYKTDPRFAWFSGDMTLVFLGISIVAGLVPLLRGAMLYRPGVEAVVAGVVFVLWVAMGQLWSPSTVYAHEKLIHAAGVILWCLVASALIIGSSRIRVWRFFWLLLFFGSLAVVDHVLAYLGTSGLWYVRYYLSLGRFAGLTAVVAFAFWLRSPPLSARGIFFLAIFMLSGYLLMIGGGRVPTISLAVATLLPLLVSFRLHQARLVISKASLPVLGFIALLVTALTLLAISAEESLRTLQRFDVLMSEDHGDSASNRFDFWRAAISYWAERPLTGQGLGAFSVFYFGEDVKRFPHNLILELLMELGLIGLVLFGVLVVVLARRVSLRWLRTDPALLCATMLCIYTFVGAMSSGDLADNRNFFTMLGLLAMGRPRRLVDDTESRSSNVGTSAV